MSLERARQLGFLSGHPMSTRPNPNPTRPHSANAERGRNLATYDHVRALKLHGRQSGMRRAASNTSIPPTSRQFSVVVREVSGIYSSAHPYVCNGAQWCLPRDPCADRRAAPRKIWPGSATRVALSRFRGSREWTVATIGRDVMSYDFPTIRKEFETMRRRSDKQVLLGLAPVLTSNTLPLCQNTDA